MSLGVTYKDEFTRCAKIFLAIGGIINRNLHPPEAAYMYLETFLADKNYPAMYSFIKP